MSREEKLGKGALAVDAMLDKFDELGIEFFDALTLLRQAEYNILSRIQYDSDLLEGAETNGKH